MKLPVSWLRSCINVPWSDRELADRLTMLGFEVEGIEPVAPAFSGVVIAEIVSAEPHPDAQKLKVCKVSIGAGEELQIVCGAPNARAGLRSALAVVGARLPGDIPIKAAKLRGIESHGMLCSATELGLPAGSPGILELPDDAPVGTALRDYLDLDDQTLEIAITPNRGDAMSVLGLAREIAARAGLALRIPVPEAVPAGNTARFAVRLQPGAGAARFAHRVIRGVDNRRPVPGWLRTRLERSGLRSISPLVDVTNYVLLEYGQPMHAYDLAKLHGGIEARAARGGEMLVLLDGREIALSGDVLVIADDAGPVGMAGIMGGERSAISETTSEVLFEVAWFDPAAIAGRARRHGLQTDASQRFERGVDPAGQERALARATELLCAIAGGIPGPVGLEELPDELPARSPVTLRATQIERLLGAPVPASEVDGLLAALGMQVTTTQPGTWQVTPPSWRFDITIEADLIEELVRLRGLDSIAEQTPRGVRTLAGVSESRVDERSVLQLLAARGYQEAVTFGFTDPALQQRLLGDEPAIALRNPIASNLSVLRASLWPGLLVATLENQRHQRERVRLFEIATRFRRGAGGTVEETNTIAGVTLGARLPEQWGASHEHGDFHDLKGDVSALLALAGQGATHHFESQATPPPCLHPGRCARIVRDGHVIGTLGELHPALVRDMNFTYAPQLFELSYQAVTSTVPVRFAPVSAFPQIRRDISFTVPTSEPFGRIAERVSVAASTRLKELRVFDIYQGKGVESGRRSVALGLILQDIDRTLTDADADEVVAKVCAELRSSLDAKLRE